MLFSQIRNVERAAGAVKFRGAALLILRALEIRQHIRESPVGVSQFAPTIVISGVAANVNHRVHRTGAAENFSSRPVEPAIREMRFGLGGIIPIDLAAEKFRECQRDADFFFSVRATGLEKKDARIAILAEARGENATRCPRANDDVVEQCASGRLSPEILTQSGAGTCRLARCRTECERQHRHVHLAAGLRGGSQGQPARVYAAEGKSAWRGMLKQVACSGIIRSGERPWDQL